MDISRHIQVVSEEGQLLARAAEEAGPDAKVPTCPDWEVRDLLKHTGMVHRWAAAFIAERRTEFRLGGQLPDLDGAALLDWFREGHATLVDTLTSTPPDVECWAFLPAPSPLAFWARRQANETTVHRVDAESARGGTPSPVGVDFAVDGIEELLLGFHAREKSQVRSEVPRVLRVRATDAGAEWSWTVRLSDGPPVAERGVTAPADCEVSGQAARLYLALWNRLPFPEVSGDRSLAALWRHKSAIVMR
ncbi:maleylpyruvate isomerase family mycothiol-dependent enzyme [Streptomyces sp. BG9H]|uniref:Maleylpyruvate isomerase family mycothiol-dependent enzyme n=1 Tax=Streptomyces anatolicus TaxID=2675858 RepID=A0ABS6YT42_9ACTN|nr:maleylpyruvate isomerase family mycothiol-dependent enzyme [Streptomyces anatolicus]MBW5424245.1 maleylpyruvate isomerase family mycothiol-dependent enzyme [Streptomyces anatolicus]